MAGFAGCKSGAGSGAEDSLMNSVDGGLKRDWKYGLLGLVSALNCPKNTGGLSVGAIAPTARPMGCSSPLTSVGSGCRRRAPAPTWGLSDASSRYKQTAARPGTMARIRSVHPHRHAGRLSSRRATWSGYDGRGARRGLGWRLEESGLVRRFIWFVRSSLTSLVSGPARE